jgi:hypothetical protein
MVQWPAACTLNDSTPESPVIWVLPDPDVAMSLGRLPEDPFWLVFEMLKLVAWQLPSEQSLLPEYDQDTTMLPLAGTLNPGVFSLPEPDQVPSIVPAGPEVAGWYTVLWTVFVGPGTGTLVVTTGPGTVAVVVTVTVGPATVFVLVVAQPAAAAAITASKRTRSTTVRLFIFRPPFLVYYCR